MWGKTYLLTELPYLTSLYVLAFVTGLLLEFVAVFVADGNYDVVPGLIGVV